MNSEILLESAKQLKQVSKTAYEEYASKNTIMLSMINSALTIRPDITSLIGANNMEMMKDNHANHLRFINSILQFYMPNILVESVVWVFRAYRSHGFSTNYWAAQLAAWHIIIKEVLTEESYKEIYPYYEWMQVNIPIFAVLSDEYLETKKY